MVNTSKSKFSPTYILARFRESLPIAYILAYGLRRLIISKNGLIAKGMEAELERLMKVHGHHTLLPLYVERGVYNFYLEVQKGEAVVHLASPFGRPGPP